MVSCVGYPAHSLWGGGPLFRSTLGSAIPNGLPDQQPSYLPLSPFLSSAFALSFGFCNLLLAAKAFIPYKRCHPSQTLPAPTDPPPTNQAKPAQMAGSNSLCTALWTSFAAFFLHDATENLGLVNWAPLPIETVSASSMPPVGKPGFQQPVSASQVSFFGL